MQGGHLCTAGDLDLEDAISTCFCDEKVLTVYRCSAQACERVSRVSERSNGAHNRLTENLQGELGTFRKLGEGISR